MDVSTAQDHCLAIGSINAANRVKRCPDGVTK